MSSDCRIQLFGDDEHNTLRICGSTADIYPSASSALDYDRVTASNKIKIKPAVKFFWEYQYYLGRLICRHKYTPLIAYCINNKSTGTPNSTDNCSMIRLRNTDTSRKLLLRDFHGKVVTMDFADKEEPVLAVLDRSCTLHVFTILPSSTSEDSYVAHTLLVLRSDTSQPETDNQSLCWCPWKPGSSMKLSTLDQGVLKLGLPAHPSMLLSISCGGKVEVMDVEAVSSLLNSRFPSHSATEFPESANSWNRDQLSQAIADNSAADFIYAKTGDHGNTVTALSVSRDGSCAASACLDGQVRIFTLLQDKGYGEDGNLSPVHTFSPHAGLPLHGLIFVDDDTMSGSNGTWRHLITGAQYNRELRLWSCSDWSCLQTLRFCVAERTSQAVSDTSEAQFSSSAPSARPSIIMALDYSKSLLVAADITRRVLYILALTKQSANEPNAGGDSPDSQTLMFTSISEFLLTTPCILFALGPCDRRNLPLSECPSATDESNQAVDLINLEIHSIHTWHLLNGTITFELPHWTKPDAEANDVQTVEDSVKSSQADPSEPVSEPVRFTIGGAYETFQNPDQLLPTSATEEAHFPETVVEMGEEIVDQAPEDDNEDFHPLRPSDFSPESLPAPPSADGGEDDDGDRLPTVDLDFPLDLTPSTFHTPKHLPEGVESAEHNTDSSTVAQSEDKSVTKTAHPVVPFEAIEDAMRASERNPSGKRSPSPDACQLEELRNELDLLNNLLSPQNDETTLRDEDDVHNPQEGSSSDVDVNISNPSASDLQELVDSSVDASRSPLVNLKGSIATRLLKEEGDKSRAAQQVDGPRNAGRRGSLSLHPGANWSTMSLCSSPGSSSSSTADTPVGSDEVIQAPDSNDVPLNLSAFDADRPALDSGSGQMDGVVDLLRFLVADSTKRSHQMEMVLDKLKQTQDQLDRISQVQMELSKRLQTSTANGTKPLGSTHHYASKTSSASDGECCYPSSPVVQTNHLAATVQPSTLQQAGTDEGKLPEWAKQILLQLRTQQGDYARRFSHLESMMNKVSTSTNELKKNQAKPAIQQSSTEPRLDQLPKMTCDLLKPVVRSEVQNAIVNNTQKLIDPLQKTIFRAIQESLNGLPSTVSESLSRLMRDKSFSNQFSRLLSSTLSADLNGAYRDSLLRVFIPALEKNIQRLFQELDVVFRAGTQQYLKEVQKHAQAQSDPSTLANTICAELAPELKNVLSSTLSTRVDEPGAFKTDPRTMGTLRDNGSLPAVGTQDVSSKPPLYKNKSPIRRPPPTEDDHAVLAAPPAVPSRGIPSTKSLWTVDRGAGENQIAAPAAQAPGSSVAPKPATTLTKKEEFARLLGQAQTLIGSDRLVDALELALVSTNQALVLDVCNDIDPDRLFRSGKYIIAQNILLSLIHQLSCGDLAVQLDLKLRYLEEAVGCLNKRDPTTTQHGPRIINLLSRRLDTFLNNALVGGISKLSPSVHSRIVKLNHFAISLFETKSAYK
ncbi:enhancer of mRNA decapping 4 [Clonorchis sinensis]|uniref:Enhancer of mRNA decapping 4 n=1 Tax=Clonorchis sinensis TaxID=79923 RepID=A0A8T1M1Z1_CLOSI|nr:enhancer of mRNA decapping 4 [Clonorchis sinensis]